MIKISKQNNSLIVEGIDNVFYINNGDNSYPLNSLIVVTDKSDMATFRSVATNDVLFSGLIQNITINGEAVTKDNIIQKFDAVSNSSTGGGGTVDAYTKEEADNKFASKDELANVQTVANDADTKVDALTPRVESVETSMNGKQDTLVSGTNIKTVNSQSILGEGNIEISDYYTKTEADEIFATTTQVNHQAADISALQTDMRGKQATLVSGENIKTINGESVLGEGNIEVSGGIKTYEASEVPSVLLKELKDAVSNVLNKKDYSKYTTTDVTPISQFLSNLSNGDYLKLYNSNEQKLQFIGSKIVGTDFYYYFNIIVVGTDKTKIYSNYITVTVLSSQIYVGNNKSVEVAKITDIPNTDNFATKDELTAVETVANNANTKADAATSRVQSVETSLGNKQDILVSGTNIKTINNQSILGEGNITIEGGDIDLSNYYNKTEVDTKLDTKQNTLVSGTNIKTINSQSILGEGNIEVTIPDATTATSGAMSAADKTKLDSMLNEWTGTQAEYDALATKDNNTIYYVTE